MKISTKIRYGMRLMVNLGADYGKGPKFLNDVAREEGISEKYLSQIVIPLRRAGLIDSYRGSKGGYVLLKHPKDISVKEIFNALEGALTLVHCIEDHANCPRREKCITRFLWRDLGDKINNVLGSMKLEGLVEQFKDKNKKEPEMMYYI